jgi:hypothetical protein
MYPNKNVIVDVNVHTNGESEVTPKVFTSRNDTYGAIRFGRTTTIYFDTTEAIDKTISAMKEMRDEFVAAQAE